MRRITFILMAAFFCSNVWAQCPTGDITLSTQQQIDDFAANYPGCTEIPGSITISGNGIESLSGLSQLTSIGGNLSIGGTILNNLSGLENLNSVGGSLHITDDFLFNLTGLEGLSSVGGDLLIDNNFSLMTLAGLESLSTVGGDLHISHNFSLETLTELGNLSTVGGDLLIYANDFLPSLAGLENLISVGGDLLIDYNTYLETLTGLDNLSTVGGDLLIDRNYSLETLIALGNLISVGGDLRLDSNSNLTTLTGLDNLSTVGGDLYINFNDSLADLTAFENLTLINGKLTISDGDALPNLIGLENIDYTTITDLEIIDNENLSICDLPNICTYLENGGTANIYDNSTGCDTQLEVELTCLPCPTGDITLSTQQQIDDFAANYPGCTEIPGSITIINGNGIESLSGLSQLTSIGGNLSIVGIILNNLSGLENLNSVGGSLHITDVILNNLTGLEGLSSVGGDLLIDGNFSLATLTGLESLSSIGGDLSISYNINLFTSLTGLDNLSTVGGDLLIYANDFLPSLAGLENLISVGGDLLIDYNTYLETLTGLENLSSVGESLYITNNYALPSLAGLENIDYTTITDLEITDNENLSICDLPNICTYLENGGTANIYNNSTGCDTQLEVELTCISDCPLGDVSLSTQAEIDDFVSNFSACETILGDLSIGIESQGTGFDLSGLSSITTIMGDLSFAGYQVDDLTGLESITYIGGNLEFSLTNNLSDISAFDHPIYIGGDISIFDSAFFGCTVQAFCDHVAMGGTITENYTNTTVPVCMIDAQYNCAECPLGDISLSTQVEIDDFVSNFSTCDTILGDLSIGMESQGAGFDLSGLSSITTILGDLNLLGTQVNDLTGLESITHIGGDLTFTATNVSDISAFDHEMYIGGDIVIFVDTYFGCFVQAFCDHVAMGGTITETYSNTTVPVCMIDVQYNCTGMPVCPTGDITLSTQQQIDEFALTYPGCTEISGDITIGLPSTSSSNDITSLAGLSQLTSLGGDLYIRNSPALTNLTGLENLSSIGGDLYVWNNAALTTLTGLESLSSVEGYLYIRDNHALTSLTGLENLSSIEGDLYVWNNAALTTLTALENLSSTGGFLYIRDNAALMSLTGLENLSSVGGYLYIWNNAALTTLTGLESLSSVEGYLYIRDNHALTSLIGLENLNSVGSYLYIRHNDALTTLTGLEGLSSVGGYLSINFNDVLTNLTGLEGLSSVEGDLNIRYNNALMALTGLENLGIVREDLFIENNPALTTLTGLENLSSVRDDLNIKNNDALTNLTGLENLILVRENVSIENNVALTALTGLESIIKIKGEYLSIKNNPNLSLCNVPGVCHYLLDIELNAEGMALIEGNAPGCNDAEEISSLCGGFSIVEVQTFYDANQNQVQDTDEPSFDGMVNVEPINGTYTGNDSIYLFSGNYTISFDQTAFPDWVLTTDSASYFVILEEYDQEPITFGVFPRESSLPNDKHVYPSTDNYVSFGEDLVYTIRFQNTGDNTSDNIIIRDTLDTNLDYDSFYLLGSSHPDNLNTNVSPDGVLTFEFNDIFLPDSMSNFEDSRGYVAYLIRPIDGLAEGTSITNSASIYFDLNSPILTNTTESIMVSELPALPIETLDPLRAYLNDQTTLLTWRTATENNNSGFEIQRSKDGIQWERIGWQAGQGNSLTPHAYTYTDESPLFGRSYYRFKQVDFNGDFTYSNIVVITLHDTHSGITIFPNPNTGIFNVQVITQGIYKILNTSGQTIQSGELKNETTIDISSEVQGVYFISISIDNQIITERIVKM